LIESGREEKSGPEFAEGAKGHFELESGGDVTRFDDFSAASLVLPRRILISGLFDRLMPSILTRPAGKRTI
jgi:hypothetical protein